jgi:3-hydroxyisobutyrate dehydrogenase-like beta-hydroxyacid dehydrogenase
MKVGFVGLGQMGRPMAERLVGAGHSLKVYNRTRVAAEPLARAGAQVCQRAEEVLDAEVVVSMVADDAAVVAVWLDSGMAQRMPKGVAHLNMSTVSMAIARRLAAEHKQGGSLYVSAPVFGRPQVAAQGQLDAVAAGMPEAIERCQPLLKAMAKQVFVVGEAPAQANAVKIARNFLLSTVIESLGEAFSLVRKAGVEGAAFQEILSATSLGSPLVKNYARIIVEQAWVPAQFSMPLGLKDVELALAMAQEVGVPLPSAELIRKNLVAAIEAGRGEQDWVGLAGHIANRAGLSG